MSNEAAVVRRFWELMEARDWPAARALLHPSFIADWPQANERFRGADSFMAMNKAHPAPNWHIVSLSVQAAEHEIVAEVLVTNDEGADLAIGFYEVQGGVLTHAREYWVPRRTEPTPAWRAAWTEMIDP